MPIYEYACGSCGHQFEAKQRFSDDPIASCPECGQAVHRVLHPAGIIFKGSGFYINDSRKADTRSGASSSSSSGTTSVSKSSTPTETASAPAADAH